MYLVILLFHFSIKFINHSSNMSVINWLELIENSDNLKVKYFMC